MKSQNDPGSVMSQIEVDWTLQSRMSLSISNKRDGKSAEKVG